MYITESQARKLGNYFRINFDVVKFNEWHDGLNVELEHGSKFGPLTNVSKNVLKTTAKIVMAHLIEDPQYYYYLKKLEKHRENYWKNYSKPNIFLS